MTNQWKVENTGGGCEALALGREEGDAVYVLITAEDDPSVPADPQAQCHVGVYRSTDEEPLMDVMTVGNLALAKRIGERMFEFWMDEVSVPDGTFRGRCPRCKGVADFPAWFDYGVDDGAYPVCPNPDHEDDVTMERRR